MNPAQAAIETNRRQIDWRFLVGGSILVIFALVALLGPVLNDYDHVGTSTRDRLLSPLETTSTDAIAWLGTDELGRDLAAQVILGTRVSFIVGVATVLAAGVVGMALGIIAGYFGGVTDSVISRFIELQLAVPPFLLAILIAAVLGPSITNLVLVLALTRWVKFARVARGGSLKLREETFVQAGRVLGVSNVRILIRYVFPMLLTPLVILATVEFGLVILAEAGLSFLGLGAPLTIPSWGALIATGRQYLDLAWWISVVPGVCLVLVGIAAGLVGDGLRDRLDPDSAA